MKKFNYAILVSIVFFIISCENDPAPSSVAKMVRLSRIVVDSTQLESYKMHLKEEIETSVKLEPGVLTLYAVFEKENPTHLTILEMYADTTAYRSHIKTPHFLKYKTATLAMVKELQLIDTDPLIPALKIK
jgi:4-carboxymuconolactone decarboxylase